MNPEDDDDFDVFDDMDDDDYFADWPDDAYPDDDDLDEVGDLYGFELEHTIH